MCHGQASWMVDGDDKVWAYYMGKKGSKMDSIPIEAGAQVMFVGF